MLADTLECPRCGADLFGVGFHVYGYAKPTWRCRCGCLVAVDGTPVGLTENELQELQEAQEARRRLLEAGDLIHTVFSLRDPSGLTDAALDRAEREIEEESRKRRDKFGGGQQRRAGHDPLRTDLNYHGAEGYRG